MRQEAKPSLISPIPYENWNPLLRSVQLNYCEKNPDTCKNNGKCQSLEADDGHFRCECTSGVSGKNCERQPETSTVATNNITTSEVTTTTTVTDEYGDTSEEETVEKTTEKIVEDVTDKDIKNSSALSISKRIGSSPVIALWKESSTKEK
ncbi:Uncharacterized protein OBRU01_07458 [Operophtera brumata]|uniref:EGF-like domain-containing protein n=1 Tax=Operophtera brumata TaxID=104452 RepID=A0A0L7LAA5_OPEBR|nr:Uncharacterized protein OBRU01_07458 [Operophtera brumata]